MALHLVLALWLSLLLWQFSWSFLLVEPPSSWLLLLLFRALLLLLLALLQDEERHEEWSSLLLPASAHPRGLLASIPTSGVLLRLLSFGL